MSGKLITNVTHDEYDSEGILNEVSYSLMYDQTNNTFYLEDDNKNIVPLNVVVKDLPDDIDLSSWEGIIEVVAIARAQLDKEIGIDSKTVNNLGSKTYIRTVWRNNITPLDEANLNNIENGLFYAYDRLNTIDRMFDAKTASLRNNLNINGYDLKNIRNISGASLDVGEIRVGKDGGVIKLSDGTVELNDCNLTVNGDGSFKKLHVGELDVTTLNYPINKKTKNLTVEGTLTVGNIVAPKDGSLSLTVDSLTVNSIQLKDTSKPLSINGDLDVTGKLNTTGIVNSGNIQTDTIGVVNTIKVGTDPTSGVLIEDNDGVGSIRTNNISTDYITFKDKQNRITINYGTSLPNADDAEVGDIFFVIAE